MIKIQKSITADSRSCDYKKVSVGQLRESTFQHKEDIIKAVKFFTNMLTEQAYVHDNHKLDTIKHFHKCFVGGFKDQSWWDEHKKEKHHLANKDDVDMENVNLVDVLEYISDCVVARKARTGKVSEVNIDNEVLKRAFKNTVNLLIENIEVEE